MLSPESLASLAPSAPPPVDVDAAANAAALASPPAPPVLAPQTPEPQAKKPRKASAGATSATSPGPVDGPGPASATRAASSMAALAPPPVPSSELAQAIAARDAAAAGIEAAKQIASEAQANVAAAERSLLQDRSLAAMATLAAAKERTVLAAAALDAASGELQRTEEALAVARRRVASQVAATSFDNQGELFESIAAALLAPLVAAIDQAAQTADASRAEADAAALAIGPAEQAVLRERSPEAHAQLEAARLQLNRARELQALAERDHADRREALEAARRELARETLDAALESIDKAATMAALAPIIERIWSLFGALLDEVNTIDAALNQRRKLVSTVPMLARLAGVDMRARAQVDPWRAVLSYDGFPRGLDRADVRAAVREALTVRAKAAGLALDTPLWLTPWGA